MWLPLLCSMSLASPWVIIAEEGIEVSEPGAQVFRLEEDLSAEKERVEMAAAECRAGAAHSPGISVIRPGCVRFLRRDPTRPIAG